MERRERGIVLGIFGALAAFALACEVSPGFARRMLEDVSRPAMALLHRLTAPVPFPIAEALALVLAGMPVLSLIPAALRAALRRDPEPLGRWRSGFCRAALALAGGLALLWMPARALPVDAPPIPDAGQLEWLCGELIDALNAAPLAFPDAVESLSLAPGVAGVGRAVKAVRYPEWMRAIRISGLYVPLTGEALADAGAPGPLLPFTAVHELTHLAGVADEGAANIAAWQRCLEAGGAFADSARLWALRYAMALLGRADAPARLRCYEKMEGALASVFQDVNGEVALAAPSALSLSGGDYVALVGYLTG